MILTGHRFDQSRFTVRESIGIIDSSAVLDVLSGTSPAYAGRSIYQEAICEKIVGNFWNHENLKPRGDGVDGYVIGAYHYGKSSREYINAVNSSKADMETLYENALDPAEWLRQQIKPALRARSIEFRAARYHEQSAGGSRALSWTKVAQYALDPHDDVGQLTRPDQRDFEIQRAKYSTVVAVNMYPFVPDGTGEVRIWNIQPDDESRHQLGLDHTGYPYEPRLLESTEFIDIAVHTGDISIFNGKQVHAVLGEDVPKPIGKQRLLITFFMGFVNDDTVVWWT